MTLLPMFALALAPNPPVPINEAQMQDIGCVAVIGIIAAEQRGKPDVVSDFPDVRESGKRWAGIVGQRVMDESGQPREVVAFAIKQAVEAEQEQAMRAASPLVAAAHVKTRFGQCNAIMDAQLAAADDATLVAVVDNSASMLVPEPERNTDDPARIALYRQQLGEDLGNPVNIHFCAGMLGSAAKEISGREGADSRDAKAFGRIARALDLKATSLSGVKSPKADDATEQLSEMTTEADKEEVIARCIRLGESLALALPPE